MKTFNRKMPHSIRLTTAIAAGVLAASALVTGSAAAESRSTPVPYRVATAVSYSQANAGRAVRAADDLLSASARPVRRTSDDRAMQSDWPYGPQGPWYR